MHRLLIWTSKGGCGKTTTCANLGPELAKLGYNVLMVDFDPQGDLGATFGVDEDSNVTRIETLLGGRGDPREAAIDIPLPAPPGKRFKKGAGRLRLLACSSELHGATAAVARTGYDALDGVLAAFEDDVDLALIDTQGALTPLSHTAARAADSVLFTMEPGYYEFRALQARLSELERMRDEDELTIEPLGVLFVRTPSRSRQMREYREHLESTDTFNGKTLYVFNAHTRSQASVRDHARLAQPTVLADPASHVAVDYHAFAAELVKRLSQLAKQMAAAK